MPSNLLLILIGSQLLFTSSDLLARSVLIREGFHLATFLQGWFVIYFLARQAAMFGQLYILSSVELGRNAALFGACSIIVANVLGFLLLRESLAPAQYVGVSLAICALLLLVWQPAH